MFLLDQRGTGRSTPVSLETMIRFGSPEEQAGYLENFRADSIVRDAELIREKLLGKNRKWSLLGQSFGGFVATTYLSFAPERLESVMITGGIPPVGCTADEVYRATYRRVAGKNKQYYSRYPEDIERVREIVEGLRTESVRLPTGDPLTPERFLQIGLNLGFSYGFEMIHYLVEEAFVDGGDKPRFSYTFRRMLENTLSFDTNPIYALLHEAIYCEHRSSNWAAERIRSEFPEFDLRSEGPALFTGEMVYPWFFEQYETLRPLKEAANLLADKSDWGALYDSKVLATNSVPVAAAIYYDDMYVDLALSEQTARGINGIQLWVTNQFEHDGIRAAGNEVADKLIGLLAGKAQFHFF